MNCPYCGQPDAKRTKAELIINRYTVYYTCTHRNCGKSFLSWNELGNPGEYKNHFSTPSGDRIQPCEKIVVYQVTISCGDILTYTSLEDVLESEIREGIDCVAMGEDYTLNIRRIEMTWPELEALPDY